MLESKNLQEQISELQKYLTDIETEFGQDSIQYADALDHFSSFLHRSNFRLDDASIMQRCALDIRTKAQLVNNNNSKKDPNATDTKECQFCAELIKKKAILCKFCHSRIPNEQQPSKDNTTRFDNSSLKLPEKPRNNNYWQSNPLLWVICSASIVGLVLVGLFASKNINIGRTTSTLQVKKASANNFVSKQVNPDNTNLATDKLPVLSPENTVLNHNDITANEWTGDYQRIKMEDGNSDEPSSANLKILSLGNNKFKFEAHTEITLGDPPITYTGDAAGIAELSNGKAIYKDNELGGTVTLTYDGKEMKMSAEPWSVFCGLNANLNGTYIKIKNRAPKFNNETDRYSKGKYDFIPKSNSNQQIKEHNWKSLEELGKRLGEKGNYAAAKSAFIQAKNSNPPPENLSEINEYIDAANAALSHPKQ